MAAPPRQPIPFDERPSVVNGALAAWVGLMAAVVVSLQGFDAADPLRNGWVRLAGLALTAGLLLWAFRARTEGGARRLQLGVAASLVLHTLGAIGLAGVSLRTEADPFAEPEAPPLADKARTLQPRLAYAPRQDAPVRPEFEQPVSTAEIKPPDALAAGLPIAKPMTPLIKPPSAPLPEAAPPPLPLVEPSDEAPPIVAATTFERERVQAKPRELTFDEVLQAGPAPVVDAPRVDPVLPSLQLDRSAAPKIVSDAAPARDEPWGRRTVVSASLNPQPTIAPAPRDPSLGRSTSAPLVDVAPLEFEPAGPAPPKGVPARSGVARRRASIEPPVARLPVARLPVDRLSVEPFPDFSPPETAAPVIGNGPTPQPRNTSVQQTPPPGSLPRVDPVTPRDRRRIGLSDALATVAPSPPVIGQRPRGRASASIDPNPDPAGTTTTVLPPGVNRQRLSVAAPPLSLPIVNGTTPPAVQSSPEVVAAPPRISVGTPPSIVARAPRVASASRGGRLSPLPLGVPRGPFALPPRARNTAPAFAARLRRSSLESAAGRDAPQADAEGRDPINGGAPPRIDPAIELGLRFLVASQRPDGSWSFRESIGADGRAGSARATGAATGLALLALLGAGCDHFDDRHGATVERGLDYLIDRQRADGLLFPEIGARADDAPFSDEVWSVARYYSHGIAAIALCEAFGMTGDARLRGPAQRALDYLEATQARRLGGWRYTPGVSTDLSVTGWQLMALRSGELAGLDVNPDVYAGVRRFVESCRERSGSRVRFRYNPSAPPNDPRTSHGRRPGTVMTAVGLLSMLYLGDDPRAARMQLGANHLLEYLPTADPSADGLRVARISTIGNPLRDTYYWYYATQVMYHMGGDYWRAWNDALRPLLVDTQVKEGDLAGSWNPYRPLPDRWSHFGGRHYVTTMNLLSLEVGYRHLPLYGRGAEKPQQSSRRREEFGDRQLDAR